MDAITTVSLRRPPPLRHSPRPTGITVRALERVANSVCARVAPYRTEGSDHKRSATEVGAIFFGQDAHTAPQTQLQQFPSSEHFYSSQIYRKLQ